MAAKIQLAMAFQNRAPKVSVFTFSVFFLLLSLCFSRSSGQQGTPFACDTESNPAVAGFGFCNSSLGFEARVEDLVKRLTLTEKIGFLVSKAGSVTRLGIPKYEWWSEALHGVSRVGQGTSFSTVVPGATSFPQVILTAASFNATLFETIGKVSPQDLEDTFQPPFKSCVIDGNVASVMCSYNQVNGKPTCADPDLLAGVIRGQWKLNGYVSFFLSFALTGLDLDCGNFLGEHTEAAVTAGLVNETAIDRAVSNNAMTLMRLGFFDGNPSKQLYGKLGPNDVCTPENQELAREAARQGIVLLKNSPKSLPLSPSAIKSLAVIGPNANVTDTMIGNYAGIPCKYTTPLQGLSAIVSTSYQPGCIDVACVSAQLDEAKKIAASADATVLVVGTNQSIEAESRDRVDLNLPGQQALLITEVAKASKGPVILVIMTGGGMDVTFAKNDDKITSILWVGFPGEAGGAAIADVIFGSFNPSGRLPMTWYPQSYVEKVPMTDMRMRPDASTGYPGRTYRFYKGETVYSFGDGLSYTDFKHHLVQAPEMVSIPLEEGHTCRSSKCYSLDVVQESCQNLGFEVHLRVKNLGQRSGSHTVFLYSSPPSVHNSPQKHLLGFEKVSLEAGGETVVQFKVDVCKDLSVADETGSRKVALGLHVLHVGTLKHSLNIGV